jgi:SAM-dependent methyltransferase
MPAFYNAAIHLSQRRALRPFLKTAPATRVLDVGCGVGRWTRLLAHRGAHPTGIDFSPTMVREARRRAAEDGLGNRCSFLEADIVDFELKEVFPLILGVTVLQHILDDTRFHAAILCLARHLAPGGRMVLLEVAPTRPTTRCDTPVFHARTAEEYAHAFTRAQLSCVTMAGVDPAPFKTFWLPHHRRLPRAVAVSGLALLTAFALPVDLLAGRTWVKASWHKVFVLTHASGDR